MQLTHLIIGGGGIKMFALIGAITVIYNKCHMSAITHFAGTSIGSVIALLLSIGFTISEIKTIIWAIPFEKYQSIDFSLFTSEFGTSRAEHIIKLIIAIMKQKNISKDITFKDHYDLTGKYLAINGSNISTCETIIYDYINSPSMCILDAVRISIAYPLIFTPIKSATNDYLIDGGLFEPYLIELFDNVPIDKKIGVLLHSKQKPIESIEDYISGIMSSIMTQREHKLLKQYKNCTIVIDSSNISSLNLSITEQDKEMMFNNGAKCAEEFFSSISK